jgi:hypothetical protein
MAAISCWRPTMQSRNTELLRATLAGSLMLAALVAGAAVAGR